MDLRLSTYPGTVSQAVVIGRMAEAYKINIARRLLQSPGRLALDPPVRSAAERADHGDRHRRRGMEGRAGDAPADHRERRHQLPTAPGWGADIDEEVLRPIRGRGPRRGSARRSTGCHPNRWPRGRSPDLQPREDAIGEVFDDADRRFRGGYSMIWCRPWRSSACNCSTSSAGSPTRHEAWIRSGRQEAGLLGIDEAVVAGVQALVADLGRVSLSHFM